MKSAKKKTHSPVKKDLKMVDSDEEEQLFFISTDPSKEIKTLEEGVDHEKVDDLKKEEDESEEKAIHEKKKKREFPLQQYSKQKEMNLEKFLFGKSQPFKKDVKSEDEIESSESSADETDEEDNEDEDKDGDRVKKPRLDSESKPSSSKRRPVWHDEDDDNVLVKDVTATYTKAIGKHGLKETSTENYAESLRKKFTSLVDTPKWADLDLQKTTADDSDDEFFRETTNMLESGRQESLRKGILEYRKLKDINYQTHNEGAVIRTCEFHPTATVALVGGLSGTASIFQIDGKTNPKIQTVNFENFPIRTAHFTHDGKKFIVGSKHFGHFYVYDMYAGKIIKVPWKEDRETNMQKFEVSQANDLIAFQGNYGYIHLVSAKSFSKVFSLKMNDNVTSLAFSPDGEKLYSHGVGGEVYIWDLKAQDCLHRFWDDGSIRGTAINISRNNRYLATGSDSGVVNIYRTSDLTTSNRPKPEKIVLNLTTSVGSVKFNSTSEILAMSSEVVDNAIKLLHLPSMTVFSNFPGNSFNLKRVNCVDFSVNGGYMAVGNNRGAANLYRLKHFGSF